VFLACATTLQNDLFPIDNWHARNSRRIVGFDAVPSKDFLTRMIACRHPRWPAFCLRSRATNRLPSSPLADRQSCWSKVCGQRRTAVGPATDTSCDPDDGHPHPVETSLFPDQPLSPMCRCNHRSRHRIQLALSCSTAVPHCAGSTDGQAEFNRNGC